MAKRHDKGEELSRAQIVSVALALFSERGVERSSLSDIAARAGISKGTLNYYYASKELLVLDAAQELASGLTRALIGILPKLMRDTTYEQAQTLLAEASFPGNESGRTAARLLIAFFHEAETGGEALREALWRNVQKWSAALEVGVLRARADLGRFCERVFELLLVEAARRLVKEWK